MAGVALLRAIGRVGQGVQATARRFPGTVGEARMGFDAESLPE